MGVAASLLGVIFSSGGAAPCPASFPGSLVLQLPSLLGQFPVRTWLESAPVLVLLIFSEVHARLLALTKRPTAFLEVQVPQTIEMH